MDEDFSFMEYYTTQLVNSNVRGSLLNATSRSKKSVYTVEIIAESSPEYFPVGKTTSHTHKKNVILNTVHV
jgi:hypothetical protein